MLSSLLLGLFAIFLGVEAYELQKGKDMAVAAFVEGQHQTNIMCVYIYFFDLLQLLKDCIYSSQ